MSNESIKIYASCVVKDEEDIIELSLRHASKFCSKIFVIDNDSHDSTWEIVNRLSREVPQVVPFLQSKLFFNDGLRAIPWQEYYPRLKHNGKAWWMILDADELFEGDPREYLARAQDEGADMVSVYQAQFYITREDVQEGNFLNKKICESIQDLPGFYCINWREPRFFKCKPGLEWEPFLRYPDKASSQHYPRGVSKESTVNPVQRHYQYRSIEQIKDRLYKRKLAFEKGARSMVHYNYIDPRVYVKFRIRLRKLKDDNLRLTLNDEFRVKFLQKLSSRTRGWLRRKSLIV